MSTLSDVLTARGSSRAQLASALFSVPEHTRALIESADALKPNDWKVLRDLAYKHVPRSRTPEQLENFLHLCRTMMEKGNAVGVEGAVFVLEKLDPAERAALVPMLEDYMSKPTQDWHVLSLVVRLYASLPLPATQRARALAHLEQSPFPEVALAARSGLERSGQALAPYRYEGLSRSEAVALARIAGHLNGGRGVPVRYPRFQDLATRTHWEGEDPRGELVGPSGIAFKLYASLAFDDGPHYVFTKHGYKEELDFTRVSENFDVVAQGKRRLLAVIASSESQFFYCVDLAEPSSTAVWSIDHDGSGAHPFRPLDRFLLLLRPDKKRNRVWRARQRS